MNRMFCEHPTCSLEAKTTCKYHCQLSVCQQHRLEHETNLLNDFEEQLDELSNPISTLLSKSRRDLNQSEESRQRDLNRINSLFDHHLSSIDQRLKLSKKSNELILTKREQLIQYKIGDNQLTKEDYQQIETMSNQIENSLHEQHELNNHLYNQNSNIDIWPIDKENNVSTEIECIELTDSEDDLSQNPTDIRNMDRDASSSLSNNNANLSIDVHKKQEPHPIFVQEFCPLTHYGVFGLNNSHNISRFCTKINNKRRYLYSHFTRFHHIKSSIAYQLIKAIQNGCNPMETIIFPQDDNSSGIRDNIQCPFDDTAIKFNKENCIPNTPCYLSFTHQSFKDHLRCVHLITKTNAELIYNAMKDYGTISHVQFEEDLCEII